jgi:Caspase domain
MKWFFAYIFNLAVYSTYCQVIPVRWLIGDPETLSPIYTYKTTYLLKLSVDIGDGSSDSWKVQFYRNDKPYTLPNQKLKEVKLQNTPLEKGWVLNQEVELEVGENRWEVELKSLDGRSLRSKPLRIVHKTGKPNLYLLSVGVPYDLKFTKKDASAIFSKFKTQEGHLFGKVEGQVLICDSDTRFTKLGQTLSDLRYKNFAEEDLLILFFSSHGMASKAFGQFDFGLVSNDAGSGVTDERYVLFFYQKDIIQNINKLRCKRIILLDACHSGAAKGDKNWVGTFDQAQEAIKNTPSDIVAIASSSSDESSWEHPTWQHGAFTHALLEGLSGKADTPQKDSNISISELASYLKNRVPHLVDSVFHKPQNPFIIQSPQQDYPIFNYAHLHNELPNAPTPCEVEKPVESIKEIKKSVAIISVMPNQSEFDWAMTKETINALQRPLSEFIIKQGDGLFVKDGTALAILEGYPPPHQNLTAITKAEYICITSRNATVFRQLGNKWYAQTIYSFTFVDTNTKATVAKETFEIEGSGMTKQQAERAAMNLVFAKLSQAKLDFYR